MDPSKDLLNLPVDMIEHVLSHLTYDEIAKNRLVCKDFDVICQRLLNRGFLMIERRHTLSLKGVKAQLPRRESERRYHPLARHCDILTSIETRISMLNMTYSKYIDNSLCCFIPGKVIDEIQRVLDTVEKSSQPLRAHEVLQELRDISSMAIEHFDDKVSPAFRKKLQEGAAVKVASESSIHNKHITDTTLLANPSLWMKEFVMLRKRVAFNSKLVTHVTCKYRKVVKKVQHYKKLVLKQNRTIREMNTKQSDQDATIADLKKRIEECDIKYSELTHTNVGGKTGTSPKGDVVPASHQPPRHFSSQIKLDLSVLPIGTGKRSSGLGSPNIKPRKAHIRLPSLSESEDDAPVSKQPRLERPKPGTTQTFTSIAKPDDNTLATGRKSYKTGSLEQEGTSGGSGILSFWYFDRKAITSRLGKRSLSESSSFGGKYDCLRDEFSKKP